MVDSLGLVIDGYADGSRLRAYCQCIESNLGRSRDPDRPSKAGGLRPWLASIWSHRNTRREGRGSPAPVCANRKV